MNLLRDKYLWCSIGLLPPSSLSSAPSVVEFDLFALVCASGKGNTVGGGRIDKEDGGPVLPLTASPSCLLADSAACFSSMACLWEGMGSAVF